MKVVIKEPKKDPVIKHINDDLKTLQEIVGGSIHAVQMPFVGDVCIVIDDEGKLKGYEPNVFFGRNDVLVGTIIFVGVEDDEFTDLNEKQIDCAFGYSALFDYYDPKVHFIPI